MESKSWLFTSARLPLLFFMSYAHLPGRPGPLPTDLTIMGSPISPFSIICFAFEKPESNRLIKPICSNTFCSWQILIILSQFSSCLLYTSDAADDLLCVDLGGRRI